jgi:DNA invertase Pin-like site-specific DNA recombinase
MKSLHSYARFSTIGQDETHGGDSERRQIEDAKSFAKRHGFTLSNLTLIDRGRGAFKGNKQAALAEFLKAIQDGLVKSGDTLLVENIDRLSRKGVRETQTIVNQIFASGVDIAILFPTEKIYRAKDVNDIGGAIELAAFAFTAHTYSANLSYRIKSKHAEQRRKAIEEGKPKTMSMIPQWCKRGKDGKIEKLPAAAKAIEYLFARTIEGCGCTRLSQELNEKFPPLGRSKYWQQSYIRRLIIDRRVLGEWQPVELDENGREQPIGDPVPNHYPQVIDRETFERANYAFAHRRNERGPSGKWVSLFTGLVYHGLDGCTCQTRANRQKLVDGTRIIHRRLLSTKHVCRNGGSPEGLYVNLFEQAILTHLRELDYSLLSADKSKRIAVDSLAIELQAKEKRLAEVQKAMKGSGDLPVLIKAAQELTAEVKALKTRIADSKASSSGLDVIKQATDTEDPETRQRLREAIKRVVRKIILFPVKLGKIKSAPVAAVASMELVNGHTRQLVIVQGKDGTALVQRVAMLSADEWRHAGSKALSRARRMKADDELKTVKAAKTVALNVIQSFLESAASGDQIRLISVYDIFRLQDFGSKRLKGIGTLSDPSELL